MPRLEYFLVAEDVSHDESTGRLSIFNVLDGFEAEQLPTFIPKLVVVACWLATPAEIDEHLDCQAQIEFQMPDGTKGRTFNANFTIDASRQHVLYRIGHVPIEQHGEVEVQISLNGAHQATHCITVAAPNSDHK